MKNGTSVLSKIDVGEVESELSEIHEEQAANEKRIALLEQLASLLEDSGQKKIAAPKVKSKPVSPFTAWQVLKHQIQTRDMKTPHAIRETARIGSFSPRGVQVQVSNFKKKGLLKKNGAGFLVLTEAGKNR